MRDGGSARERGEGPGIAHGDAATLSLAWFSLPSAGFWEGFWTALEGFSGHSEGIGGYWWSISGYRGSVGRKSDGVNLI